MKILKGILWLLKILFLTIMMYLKWALILLTWPISVPVLLITRSNRRHQELLNAIARSRRVRV
jgi:hypothetical protein